MKEKAAEGHIATLASILRRAPSSDVRSAVWLSAALYSQSWMSPSDHYIFRPCMSKYKSSTLKLRMAHYISYSLFDSPLLLG